MYETFLYNSIPEGAAAGVADPSRGDDAFVARNGGLGLSENDSHETGAVTLAKRVRVRG